MTGFSTEQLEHEALAGKVALITGGGSGIGRGIAAGLAQHGSKVVVCGRRKNRLEETAKMIRAAGGAALAVQADVGKEADVVRLVEQALAAFGTLDIVVNNAGISEEAPLHELDSATWDRIMETNLRGVFLVTRHTLPILRLKRSGHVLNISSESGIEYYPEDAAYGVSKHALNAFGEFVQRENQDYKIRVNTICPGMVVTEMTEDSPGLDHSRCLYPEDIAELAIFLLTRRSNIKIGTPILIQTMLNPWE